MPRRIRRTTVLTLLAASAAVASGCEGAKQTELVAGISTQVQVPRDLKTLRIDVNVGGANLFCRAYKVFDGKVLLPRTLGTIPADLERFGEPVTVTVSGYTEEYTDNTPVAAFNDCGVFPKIKRDIPGEEATGGPARVLRRSRQPYLRDKILFLPIPLRYSCFDKDCDPDDAGVERTCKGGRCVDSTIDPATLVEYRSDLLDGFGANCFSRATCMTAAVPPQIVDPATCTYALAGSASAPAVSPPLAVPLPPGAGLNVEVFYDGGFVREILDKDAEEGFTIPDAAKPQQFQLAPGLCDLVKGEDPEGKATAHRITAIRVSPTCRAKTPLEPLCADDQLAAMGASPTGDPLSPQNGGAASCRARPLQASPSALVLMADKTARMAQFYSDSSVQAAIKLSLDAPAWSRTTLGMGFFPTSSGGECAAVDNPFATLTVPMKIARDARANVVAELAKLSADPTKLLPAATPLALDKVLAVDGAYKALRALGPKSAFNRRALFLIGNHDWLKSCADAGQPLDPLVAAAKAEGIATYTVLLGKEQTPDPAVAGQAQALALAGAPDGVKGRTYDARNDGAVAAEAFQALVNDLSTCVYDAPAPVSDSVTPAARLQFVHPLTGEVTSVAHDAACSSETAKASGWGFDGARIRVCGASCTKLRDTVNAAALYSAQQGHAALAVPVFAVTGCAP